MDKSQTGIKTAGRNINNLRYADDITLKSESKEELKSLLMRVKEKSGKASLKLNIKKKKNNTTFVLIESSNLFGEIALICKSLSLYIKTSS